jgi:protein-S-isoprenylcysteine O-methyltransferase Ste14
MVAARDVKATRRHEPRLTRLLHIALIVLAAVLLAFRIEALAWLNGRFVPPTMAAYWLGLFVVAAGLAFAVWARVYLGRNWSATVTIKQDHELVRTGPYAVVRHPIYTGIVLALFGTAIVVGEWRGLLALALITIGFLFKIRTEERFMGEIFGERYARYRAEVPALIPFIV